MNGLNEEAEESRFKAAGLNTGLKPKFVLNTEKHVSKNIEVFLIAVENPSSRRISDADVSNTRTIKPEKSTKSFRN